MTTLQPTTESSQGDATGEKLIDHYTNCYLSLPKGDEMMGCLLPKEVKIDRLPLAWRCELEVYSHA
jgi:hypothetical protein